MQQDDDVPVTHDDEKPQEAAPTDKVVTTERAQSPARSVLKLALVLLIVLLYGAAIYLPFLGSGRILTRHEVSVADPALRILETGDWLIPQYVGEPWIHKPPLVIWLTAVCFAIGGGFSEFLARLPAALSAMALCLLMASVAWRFYGTKIALFTGLVQATCVYMYMQGRLGEIDMTFATLVAAAHVVLAWHWGAGELKLPLSSAVLFHVLVGLAILAKGPLAIIFVSVTVIGFCIVRRSLMPLRTTLITPAVFCSLIVGFWWYVAIVFDLGEYALGRWNYSYVYRFLGHYHMGRKPLPFYFWTIPWLVLPWTVVLILGAKQLVADVRRKDAFFERFLWVWFLGGLIFLTAAVFKHHHYSIPILPPLSVFAGKLLAEHATRLGRQRALRLHLGLFAGIAVIMAIVGGLIMPWRDYRRPRMDFVREAVSKIPADQRLVVVGLAQSAVYPYVPHKFGYVNTLADLQAQTQSTSSQPLWILTLQKYLELGKEHGFTLAVSAAEQPSKKYPKDETLVLGRLVTDKTP